MPEELTIRSTRSSAEFKLSEPEPKDPARSVEEVLVTVIKEGLIASTRIDLKREAAKLWRFFDDLAASPKGWEGRKVLKSPGGDLEVAATHDEAGLVRFSIELRSFLNDWSARGELVLESCQMGKIAEGVRVVLRT